MVVVLAPAINKMCELFTHNPLTRAQGKPIFLSLMGIHKECITNSSEFESDFGGGHHVYAYVVVGDQQYSIHSQIESVRHQKLGRMLAYPINPTYSDIAVADQKYQNNLHNCYLVKNTNIFLKKIVVEAINDQCLKRLKDLIVGYAKKAFLDLICWIYI